MRSRNVKISAAACSIDCRSYARKMTCFADRFPYGEAVFNKSALWATNQQFSIGLTSRKPVSPDFTPSESAAQIRWTPRLMDKE
jgi:hypothetical protein